MSDYISREALLRDIDNLYLRGKLTLKETINGIPAADVRPVVRGKWEVVDWVEYDGHGECIHHPSRGMRCTNCKHAFKRELLWKKNFCPNCGADMRGE